MSDEHPARAASQRSMAVLEGKAEDAREQWLALFAEDALIEDPVGVSPLDPEGRGHRGKAAIAAFWDRAIAGATLRFDIRASYACGNEVANVGRITTHGSGGGTVVVDGVFTYRVNDQGQIIALRAYWEFDQMLKTARQAGPGPHGSA